MNILFQVLNVIMYIVLALFFSVIVFIIYFFLTFNIKVRIREVTNNRKIVKDYKAKLYKDKEGVFWWKLFRGIKIPIPDEKAIEMNSKGKKVCEFWSLQDGTIVPVVDVDKEIKPDKSFTTNQRSLLINEFHKSNSRAKQGWKELLLPLASISALLILVVALMVFWGDMAKPLLEMGNKLEGFQEQQIVQQQLLNEIILNKQIIGDSAADGVPLG